jgi:hypothetical protein
MLSAAAFERSGIPPRTIAPVRVIVESKWRGDLVDRTHLTVAGIAQVARDYASGRSFARNAVRQFCTQDLKSLDFGDPNGGRHN